MATRCKQLVGYKDDDDSWYWRIKQLIEDHGPRRHEQDRSRSSCARCSTRVGTRPRARSTRRVRMAGYSMIEPAIMWGWWRIYEQIDHDKDATKAAVRAYINSLTLARLHPADVRPARRTARSRRTACRRARASRSIARPTATRAASRRSSRSICSATTSALGRRPRHLELVDVLRVEGHAAARRAARTTGGGTGGTRTIPIS